MENIRLITSQLQMLLTSLGVSRERTMVSRWKEEIEQYGARRECRRKILTAIEEGYDTHAEIVAETGIARTTCYKVLRRLVNENSVTKISFRNAKNRQEVRYEISTGK